MRDEFVQCSAERKRGDALIRCQLHAGHEGEHKWPGELVDRAMLVGEIAEWVLENVDDHGGHPVWDNGKWHDNIAHAIRERFGGKG